MGPTKLTLDDRFFTSGNVRLRYVEAGEGEAVVLLHGFLGDIETTWIDGYGDARPDVLPALARRYRTIAVDARGHGRSDKPHGSAQYGARMADDVVALLDHLDVARAHLVGYSMGSMVAAKVLTERPERLLRAVLGGGLPYLPSLYPDGPPPALAHVADELETGRGMVAYILASAREGQYGARREEAERISDHILAKQDVGALAAAARAMPELGVTEAQLAANTVPTLALIGTLDDGLSELEKVSPRMANLRIETIDGAEHASSVAHPGFLRGVERFLSDQSV